MKLNRRAAALTVALISAACCQSANAQQKVTRFGAPTAAIAQGVWVGDTLYVSGLTPDRTNPNAPAGTAPTFGDTKTQTISVMNRIKATLESQGLGMGDVVKMMVFLVGDPAKENKMDFAGMMEGYTQFFGSKDQPNKPARSTVQVVSLVGAGQLVEIEVVAVKSK
jgi:enamine deaminase RidA (YjgF/YER057c/UK114 family)